MHHDIILIYCPFPTADAARAACLTLLEQKLIACGNILLTGESHYWWEGKLVQAEECILIAKTTDAVRDRATQQLTALHSYSCPAILSFSATATSPFAAWVTSSTID